MKFRFKELTYHADQVFYAGHEYDATLEAVEHAFWKSPVEEYDREIEKEYKRDLIRFVKENGGEFIK